MVGRQHERGADQRRAIGRHVPRRGELLVDGQGRERAAPVTAAVSRRRMRTPVSSMAARSSTQLGWSQRAAAGSSTRQRSTGGRAGRGQPGAAQGGGHRRQVVGGERAVVAIPQELGDLVRATPLRARRAASLAAIDRDGRSRSASATIRAPACRSRARWRRSTRPCGRRRGGASAARRRRRGSAARAGRRCPPSAAGRGSHRRRAWRPRRPSRRAASCELNHSVAISYY